MKHCINLAKAYIMYLRYKFIWSWQLHRAIWHRKATTEQTEGYIRSAMKAIHDCEKYLQSHI